MNLSDVQRVAIACRDTDDWRGAIYLPESSTHEFKSNVPEASQDLLDNVMEGSETKEAPKVDGDEEETTSLPID
ncbi:hypothetical protein AB9M10_15525 [Rhodococcus erythropolis]